MAHGVEEEGAKGGEDGDYDGENLSSPQGREGGKIILKNVSHGGVSHALPVPCALVLTWCRGMIG